MDFNCTLVLNWNISQYSVDYNDLPLRELMPVSMLDSEKYVPPANKVALLNDIKKDIDKF